MMTAAMAFFSIALTLNLTGIKVTQLRAADFQPSRLRATLTRQYYSTNEQVTKYYENLAPGVRDGIPGTGIAALDRGRTRVRRLGRRPSRRRAMAAGSPSSTVPAGQQIPPLRPTAVPARSEEASPVLPAAMVPAGLDR